jgi:hypothetical protein
MSDGSDARWFGPRVLGWGWRPIRLEGWVLMGVTLAAVWLSYQVLGRGLLGRLVRVKLFALMFLVILITGGKPGSLLFRRRPRLPEAS